MRKEKPKELISMPFLVDRYLADTESLSLEQHGAYCLLLMNMWKDKGSLPDDDDLIARKLRIGVRQWLKLKDVLRPFLAFYGPDGERRVTQGRLQKQWNYAVTNSEIASSKASKAAKIKWERERQIKALMEASSNARSSAPSIPLSSAPGNASVVPYLSKDISSTYLTTAARGEEAEELTQTAPKAKAVAVQTLERLEQRASWRGPHAKPNAKRNGAG